MKDLLSIRDLDADALAEILILSERGDVGRARRVRAMPEGAESPRKDRLRRLSPSTGDRAAMKRLLREDMGKNFRSGGQTLLADCCKASARGVKTIAVPAVCPTGWKADFDCFQHVNWSEKNVLKVPTAIFRKRLA